jgi:Sulfotransferase family
MLASQAILGMRRPDLFLVGAPRCGTTAMYTYLRRHPGIFMSPLKEPDYFCPDIRFRQRRPPTLREYLALFARARGEQ